MLRKHELKGVLVLVAGSQDNRAIRIWKAGGGQRIQSVSNVRRKNTLLVFLGQLGTSWSAAETSRTVNGTLDVALQVQLLHRRKTLRMVEKRKFIVETRCSRER